MFYLKNHFLTFLIIILSQTFSLHSWNFVLESFLKLLSIPTFSLLSKTPLYSKLSEISIQAGSTAPIWNSDPSWNFQLKFKCWSEISIWNSSPSTAPIWNSNPSTARRTSIQTLRSKHADLPQVPIHSLCLRWCVRVWVLILLLILWLIFYLCCWFLILTVGVCV